MAWSDAARKAAAEARRRKQRLFHGTTSNVKTVLPGMGLNGKSVWLTTSAKEAREYAERRMGKPGVDPVVFVVRADKQPNLRFVKKSVGRGSSHFTTSKPLSDARRLLLRRFRERR
jgi:hypothetical protein